MKQLNDQYFTYRQTPVDYDGVARPSIKGNTLVWNQLVDSGTSSVTLTSGHIYITKVGTTWSRVSGTGESISVTGGSDFVFGLTKMFGSGNEPTLDEFRSLFPLNYYAYGQYLLNFNGTGIKTTGENLAYFPSPDYEFPRNGINVEINGSEMHIWGKATATQAVYNGSHSASYADAQLGYYLPGTYKVQVTGFKHVSNGTRMTFIALGADGSTIKSITNIGNGDVNTFTANQIFKIGVWMNVGNGDEIDLTPHFMLTTEDDVTYEPYTTSTTSLPISTYFTYGMKDIDNGRVYDELTDKAITRIGSIVVDGSQTYAYSASETGNWATINLGDKLGKVANANIQLKCSNTFTPIPFNNRTSQSTIFRAYINDSGHLVLRLPAGDTTFTTSAEAKTYFTSNPVTVNYELATYTEQDVDPIYYDFYGNGTEQLLPVNTDTPSTSPLLADIIYYTVSDSEVPYRVFWAINSKGERWDFTEREFKSFMNNPQGLGFSKTISVNRYGNAQSLTDITDNFPQPNGEVLFYDSHNSTRYDKYNQFVKYLSYEPITLYYKIPVSFYSRIPNTYSLECVVGTLTKTESKTDNMMNCSITYNALSFYKGEEVEISGTGTSYTINNDSDFPIGFEIQIDGTSMVNPYIQLSQNGNLYGEAKFIGKMNGTNPNVPFSKVYVNSKDGEQNVILEQGGSVLPNPMSYQDLSISNGSIYVTFVKLARGESTLTLGKDSGTFSAVTIRYTPIYRSV